MIAKTAIIIGGGIAGCSTAHGLAKRGLKVTLIERNPTIASEASGNPLAMLYPRLSGEEASSQFALASYLHSLALYQSLKLPPADFSSCGMLQLGFTPREQKRIQKVAALHHRTDVVRYVDSKEASTLAGIEVAHDALYFPHAGWVNPHKLCLRLTQHPNISITTAHEVTSLTNKQGLFEVYADQHLIAAADIAVIANANDAQRFFPHLPLHTQAVRGQVTLLKATQTSQSVKVILCSDGYLSPANYLYQSAPHHCLGATFSNTSGETLEVTATDHLTNLTKLNHLSPQLHQALHTHVAAGRVSLRCSSMDYWPLAGWLLDGEALRSAPVRAGSPVESLPWVKGLYMSIAHGSKGFTSAPLCAELLATLICNEALPMPAEIAGLMNPNRFLLRSLGLKRLAKLG